MTASAEVRRRLVREMRLDLVKPWKVYQMPDETTAGTSLEELKVGDKVDITVNEEDRGDDESRARAMMINKVEE